MCGRRRTAPVWYCGDLGAPYAPLLCAPTSPCTAEVVVLERTYGARQHDVRRTRRQRLQQLVERCVRDRGVVLAPALRMGRAQALVSACEAIIHQAIIRRGGALAAPGMRWEDLEIMVAPLARRCAAASRRVRPFWDAAAQRRLTTGRHPLSCEPCTTLGSHQDHLDALAYLLKSCRPAMVLAACGMCAGGRIVNDLPTCIDAATTAIVCGGYQAAGTPGGTIQRDGPRQGSVELEGQRSTIGAGVHVLGGYAAPAAQRMLYHVVRRMGRKPQHIRLAHGAAAAKASLRQALQEVCPEARIDVGLRMPDRGRSCGPHVAGVGCCA